MSTPSSPFLFGACVHCLCASRKLLVMQVEKCKRSSANHLDFQICDATLFIKDCKYGNYVSALFKIVKKADKMLMKTTVFVPETHNPPETN